MNNKIAILILLHENTEKEQRLINHLSKDFDLYIHVDKKSNILETDFSGENIYVYKKYKVFWGSYNQICATYYLLSKAAEKHYKRYILISGSDIPLKSNKEIYNFFDNNEKEYFEYEKFPRKCWGESGGYDRVDYYYMNSINGLKLKPVTKFFRIYIRKINTLLIKIFRLLKIKRKRLEIDYYGGANWTNLSDKCVQSIVEYLHTNPKLFNRFKYTFCADEIFFQTIIMNFVNNIYIENDSLRFTSWEKNSSHPNIIRMVDYEKLKKSHALFARKIDINIDHDIVNKIYQDIE